ERVVNLPLALELGLVLVLLGERVLHLLEPVVVQPRGVHMDAGESGAARPAELDRHVDRAVRVIRVVNRNADVLEHEIPLYLYLNARLGRQGPSPATACGSHYFFTSPRPAGPQPRDGLRLALLLHLASAGGGPSPATACGSHYALNAARTRPSPSPSARSSALSSWSPARRREAAPPFPCPWAGSPPAPSRPCAFRARRRPYR